MGEGQAAEVSGVDSQEQQTPQAKKVASFSPLGEGEKGRQERALAEGLRGPVTHHLTPRPYPTPGASCLPHGRWWS